MSKFTNINLSDLKSLLQYLELSKDTRFTIIFEDNKTGSAMSERKKAVESMKKLKGSGNGKLIESLLKEREKDKLTIVDSK